jgi:hypothetical protein
VSTVSPWLPLPYDEWKDTRETLHMYTQVIGKLRLALSPFEPQWANVPLYLTARGLTTSPMPIGVRTLEAAFDFFANILVLLTSDGEVERLTLGGSVADFYRDVMGALARLGVDVTLSVVPTEVPHPIPFPEDRTHHTYDAAQALRFWRVLAQIENVVKEHRVGFFGKTPPVCFFWGTFDLAVQRFSGSRVTPPPGAGTIERYAGTAEQICGGWWPGDQRYPYPAFYAYAFPKPAGLETTQVRPAGAAWNATIGEFLLPYAVARESADPRAAILDFLRSTYDAGSRLLGWPSDLTEFDVPGGAQAKAPRSVEAIAPRDERR